MKTLCAEVLCVITDAEVGVKESGMGVRRSNVSRVLLSTAPGRPAGTLFASIDKIFSHRLADYIVDRVDEIPGGPETRSMLGC
jgi:hypothetical protein